ncbi:MAG TPA: competence protein ComEC, partial [Microbacterium sp.]|nr:competence protein ComEC [Microbacterium sp.]
MSQRSARRRDLRLLPVAGGCWASAGGGIAHPDAAAAAAWVMWAGAFVALLIGFRVRATGRRRPSGPKRPSGRGGVSGALALTAVMLAFAASTVSHIAVAEPARRSVADLPIGGGRAIEIEADVVGKVESSATGYRFDALLRSVSVGEIHRPSSAPILVRAAERPPGLDLGARVHLVATAFPAENGDRAVLVATASEIEVIRAPSGPFAVAAMLRNGLVDAVDGLPEPGACLVPGLAVGDTSAVDA